jgi:hypothetical protein
MRAVGLRGVDLRATWPLVTLVALIPLWWALGLGVMIFMILAVPMAYRLILTRGVRIPPGFAIWVVFLIWNTVALANLRLNPAGTVTNDFTNRIPSAALRMLEYAAVTIMLLYAGNLSRKVMPQVALVRLLGLGFVWSVLGGLLGLAAPHFQFTSPFERLLPTTVRTNQFVQSLVHPSAAQLHDILGFTSPRPAAPWGYTNTWGYVIALTGVWFVLGCLLSRRLRSRVMAVALPLVAVAPIVYSLNRGLWLALGLIACYLAVRLALMGRVWLLATIGAALVAVSLVIALSPLQAYVTGRLDNPKSNSIRAFSVNGAIRITEQSPFLGYGSTRTALGSDQSITVGRSVGCPKCGNVPLGSNGQMWLLMVSSGFGGLILYFAFFCYLIVRYWRDTTPIGVAGVLVLVLSVFFSFVYNAMVAPLAFTMLSVALLWRNERPGGPAVTLPPTRGRRTPVQPRPVRPAVPAAPVPREALGGA